MGNSSSKQKIIKPQASTIVSVQHKEYESIHDCEELRQLKQLPKSVPLRPSTSYPFQHTNTPNPAANIGTSNFRDHSQRKTSLSDNTIKEVHENDIDSNQSRTSHYLITPSIIGSNYSNTSSRRSDDNISANKSSDSLSNQPFNPKTLRPPKLTPHAMDALYKHLREHFTSLAVKVDCNQVSCTFKIQEMDEQLAVTRANMIDIDYTSNQLQRSISSMKRLTDDITRLTEQCNDAIARVSVLWKQLPSTPRSLPVFTSESKQRRVVIEGSMVRVGSYLKGNKTRWVVLYMDGLMAYYNIHKTEVKGVIDLMDATEVIPSDISHLMITVKKDNKSTSWHFKCPSPQHVTKWLDAIRSLHFIRARSKLKYCENVPTQFLRDNTMHFMKDRLCLKSKQCVFTMIHLLNNDGYLYEMSVYSDGNRMHFMYKECMKVSNNNDENEYIIDWNLIKRRFESDIHDGYGYNNRLSLHSMDNDDIISIKISEKQSVLYFATNNCIQCIQLNEIMDAIKSDRNINMDNIEILIENKVNKDYVQSVKSIQDIEIVIYKEFELIFICDCIEHCLWCFNLKEKTFIKLINSPAPNGVTLQNDTLYITSLQCGIYHIALSDIDFNKAFACASFFSPFVAETLQIFENIVLQQIISMIVPPMDVEAPLSCTIHRSSMSNSSFTTLADLVPASILFVMDIERQLYMIRLTDLVLISFGVVENADKLFYYSKLDHLYITKASHNKIDCVCNIYHDIVSVRSSASALFGSSLNAASIKNEDERKEEIYRDEHKLSHHIQILKTPKRNDNDNDNDNVSRHNVKKHKKKHLSDADIRALMKHNHNDVNDDIMNEMNDCYHKICFPKSLYLVYETPCINDEDMMDSNNESKKMDDVEMEILVELDNMLQSYMLSELRQHSKKLLNYIKRNYSFLYLYTSPYDGESMYRELDSNYESSVPAKNLIQHSSIGPVILVKLKAPTKEQMRKQKQRDLKLKKRKKRGKNKSNE